MLLHGSARRAGFATWTTSVKTNREEMYRLVVTKNVLVVGVDVHQTTLE